MTPSESDSIAMSPAYDSAPASAASCAMTETPTTPVNDLMVALERGGIEQTAIV